MEKKRKTIIEQAKLEVEGYAEMYQKSKQKVVLGGLSSSTLVNYGRCISPRGRSGLQRKVERSNRKIPFSCKGYEQTISSKFHAES